MFNGIVFGRVGQIMRNPNFDADFIGQLLNLKLENLVTGVVAPVTIAQN